MSVRPIAMCALAALLASSAVSRAAVAQSAPPERNRALIALIDGYLANPFSEDRRAAILDSAEARPDVTITISTAVMPAFCYRDESESVRALDALLLSAFVGGNMRAQLVRGRDGEDVEAGLRAAVDVYKRITARIPNYHVPEVKDWVAAETAGELSKLAERLAKETRDCRRKAARFSKDAKLAPAQP